MSVTVVVPWPRYPVTTPGGKPSKAKNAGRMIPWLSANVVGDLAKFAHRSLVTVWRQAALAATGPCPSCGEPRHEPNEACWYMDLGRCPYFLGEGKCATGCYEEPQCRTCQPDEGWPSERAITGPVEISVRLYKATSHEMDPWAVAEGAKPLVDGLEAAGLISNDRLAFPGRMEALKAGSREECRVELEPRAVGGVA